MHWRVFRPSRKERRADGWRSQNGSIVVMMRIETYEPRLAHPLPLVTALG